MHRKAFEPSQRSALRRSRDVKEVASSETQAQSEAERLHDTLAEDIPSKQEHIVRATYRLIGGKGMHRMTLQDVAEAAGVSKAVIIYYFGTKEKLVLTTMRWVLAQVSERIRNATGAAESPQQQVRSMIDAIFIDPDRNRNFYLGYIDLVEYSARSQSFNDLSNEFRSIVDAMYAQVIRHGVAKKAFVVRDVGEAAQVVRAVIDGLFIQWLQEDDWKKTHGTYKEMCSAALLSYLESAKPTP
jgi:TetR/AcrR family fatty acid metabolism transcriptional regulator